VGLATKEWSVLRRHAQLVGHLTSERPETSDLEPRSVVASS
jgi:hypothetical protein